VFCSICLTTSIHSPCAYSSLTRFKESTDILIITIGVITNLRIGTGTCSWVTVSSRMTLVYGMTNDWSTRLTRTTLTSIALSTMISIITRGIICVCTTDTRTTLTSIVFSTNISIITRGLIWIGLINTRLFIRDRFLALGRWITGIFTQNNIINETT